MMNFKRVSNFVAVIAAFVLVVGTAMANPDPIFFEGATNTTCADLNALPDTAHGGAFAHMTTDWEFKDDTPSNTAMKDFTSGGDLWSLIGAGHTPNTNLFINYSYSDNVMTAWSLSWTGSGLDRLVSAIIVKDGASGKYVYPYNPLDNGDTGTFTVPGGGVSHIAFCFEPFTAPTAAPASVSGRVTDRYGRGISGAIITAVDLSTGETKYAYTSTFGYYKVDGLPVANFYSVGVRHSRYTFFDPVQTFSLDASLTDVNFTASR